MGIPLNSGAVPAAVSFKTIFYHSVPLPRFSTGGKAIRRSKPEDLPWQFDNNAFGNKGNNDFQVNSFTFNKISISILNEVLTVPIALQ